MWTICVLHQWCVYLYLLIMQCYTTGFCIQNALILLFSHINKVPSFVHEYTTLAQGFNKILITTECVPFSIIMMQISEIHIKCISVCMQVCRKVTVCIPFFVCIGACYCYQLKVSNDNSSSQCHALHFYKGTKTV